MQFFKVVRFPSRGENVVVFKNFTEKVFLADFEIFLQLMTNMFFEKSGHFENSNKRSKINAF